MMILEEMTVLQKQLINLPVFNQSSFKNKKRLFNANNRFYFSGCILNYTIMGNDFFSKTF